MKNMLLASNDSLFLVNNNLFFKRFGYNVTNASDYLHAVNNIKMLAQTKEKINFLVIKSRHFDKEEELQLNKILTMDNEIVVVVLSDKQRTNDEKIHFIDYYASPMQIIDSLKEN